MSKFLFLTALSFSSLSFAEGPYGIFMVVKGDVKYQRASGAPVAAKQSAKVLPGDTVISGVDSRAKIVMSDRNVIYISPSTKMTIAQYTDGKNGAAKNVEINLQEGKVLNNVEQKYDGDKNKFIIKTPTAVAGVRGTTFITSFNKVTQVTQVITQSGVVTFASLNAQGGAGGEVQVKKGEGSSAGTNAPPEPPKAVPADQMKQIESDVTGAAPQAPAAPAADTKKGDSGKDGKKDSGSGSSGKDGGSGSGSGSGKGGGFRADVGSDKAPEAVDQMPGTGTVPAAPATGAVPGVVGGGKTGNTTVTDAIRNRVEQKTKANIIINNPTAPNGR